MRTERLADEHDRGDAVKPHQFARRIREEHGLAPARRPSPVFTATAPNTREPHLGDVRLDGIRLLEVTRRKHENEVVPVPRQLRVDAQENFILARPRRATEQDLRARLRRDPVPQLRLLRGIPLRHVELETARDGDRRVGCARRDKAGLVQIGLREDAREAAEDIAEPQTGGAVARRTAIAHPRIDEEERNAALLRRADEDRPYLAFRQNDCTGLDRRKRTLHEVREVERIVDENVIRRDFALRHLPARRAGRRKAEANGWLDLAPLAHQLSGDLDFPDRDGVNPHPAALEKPSPNRFGVECEPIPHSRPIAAAPKHPQQKARQHQREDGGEKRVIDEPLHAFSVPKGESVAPGSTSFSTGVPQATVAPAPTFIPGAVQLFVPMKAWSPIVV